MPQQLAYEYISDDFQSCFAVELVIILQKKIASFWKLLAWLWVCVIWKHTFANSLWPLVCLFFSTWLQQLVIGRWSFCSDGAKRCYMQRAGGITQLTFFQRSHYNEPLCSLGCWIASCHVAQWSYPNWLNIYYSIMSHVTTCTRARFCR